MEFNSEQEKTRLHDTMIFWKQIVRMQLHKRLNARELAPRARFELATLRLTAETSKNLSALPGVAYGVKHSIFSPSVGLLGLLESAIPALLE